MNRRHAWAVAIGALLFAAVVGGIAYYAGVNTAIEDAGGGAPYPYRHHHWPWGFGFFVPMFFIFFWLVFLRGVFWRRRCGYNGGLDEWHRRAHERMNDGQREQDDPDRRR